MNTDRGKQLEHDLSRAVQRWMAQNPDWTRSECLVALTAVFARGIALAVIQGNLPSSKGDELVDGAKLAWRASVEEIGQGVVPTLLVPEH